MALVFRKTSTSMQSGESSQTRGELLWALPKVILRDF